MKLLKALLLRGYYRDTSSKNDIASISHLLTLLAKTCPYLEKMLPSDSGDEEAYQKIRQTIQELILRHQAITAIKKPTQANEHGAYAVAIQTQLLDLSHFINNNLPQIEGEQSLLIAHFFSAYIAALSNIYLHDTKNKRIESYQWPLIKNGLSLQKERALFLPILDALQKKITLWTHSGQTLISLHQFINRIELRETRLKNIENKVVPKKNRSKIYHTHSPENSDALALERLAAESLMLLQLIVQYPKNYLPIRNNKDKDELLHDLLFEKYPYEYLLIVNEYPEKLTELHRCFAFSSPNVIHYFNFPEDREPDFLSTIELELSPDYFPRQKNDLSTSARTFFGRKETSVLPVVQEQIAEEKFENTPN